MRNKDNDFIEEIDLTNDSLEDESWYVQSTPNSFIYYMHAFNTLSGIKKISVSNFYRGGFPNTNLIHCNYLISLAHRHGVLIKKIVLYNTDYSIKKEYFPLNEIVGEINVPNKNLCKIVYDVVDGDSDFEISLRDFLRNKNLQKKKGQ